MVEPKKQTFMTRLARRKKASGPASREYEGSVPMPALGESIAIVLQRERRELGRDLNRVAEDLKIRKVYLVAIEEGRFDDLPGSTYAVGFVRAYADYLRLDSEEIIVRFKQEVEGLDEHMQLVFPTPAPESKVPGGALILISALLLALAYGGWYALSSDGVNLADWVPEVPESLRALGSDDPSETAPEPMPEFSDESVEPSDGAAEPISPEPELAEDPTEPAAPMEATPAEATPVEATPVDLASVEYAAAEIAESLPVPVAEPAVAEAAPETAPETAESAPEAPEPEIETAASDLAAAVETAPSAVEEEVVTAAEAIAAEPAEEAAPAPEPLSAPPAPVIVAATEIPLAPETEGLLPEAEAREPRTYGAENVSARIVLRALLDSWVQVRDENDSLLLTRVLRPGDTYRVPNQPGLTMLTGNAGGLQIEIDGNALPRLGPIGAVRGNIALNPQRLLDGTADSR